MLFGGEGMPFGVFKLEHARGRADDLEHVKDAVGRNGCSVEGGDCNRVHEPRLERL